MYNHRASLLRGATAEVGVLRTACLRFEKAMQKITRSEIGVWEYYTAGQLFKSILTSQHLLPDTVANARKANDNDSISSVEWLEYEAIRTGDHIVHACNNGGKEHRINNRPVDGYTEALKLVREYYGCRWHGCYCEFPRNRNQKRNGLTYTPNQLYRRTMSKERMLKAAGYKVKTMWGCQWKELRKTAAAKPALDRVNADFYKGITHRGPLFGGRIETYCLYYPFAEVSKFHGSQEVGRKHDLSAAYGAIMISKPMPSRHPKMFKGNSAPSPQDVVEDAGSRGTKRYFGVMKVDIDPPSAYTKDFQFAVLPSRPSQDVRDFGLDPIRGGEYCTPELYHAIQKGYTLRRVYEYWQYVPSKEVYGDFGQKYVGLNFEARGYPPSCTTEAQKRNYVAEQAKRGLVLDPANIKSDPVMKAVAKGAYSCVLAKSAQKNDGAATIMVREKDADKFHEIMADKENEPDQRVTLLQGKDGKQSAQITFRKKAEYAQIKEETNPVLYAFVTCYARLLLLSQLEKLRREQVFYMAVDSIVWVEDLSNTREGWGKLTSSSYVGEMKDELEGKWMVEWGSIGKLSQSYELNDGTSNTQCSGLTVASKWLTLKDIKALTLGKKTKIENIKQTRLQPDKEDSTVRTVLRNYSVGVTGGTPILRADGSVWLDTRNKI